MKERIQKVLANAGIASRRNIEEMIRQGRIAVNGKLMIELPILIDPERDKVSIDDEPVRFTSRRATERVYILMNKPKDVFSTNVAQGEQTRAIDLLPPGFPRVYPVARLDAETKGLLLLTNDGELTNELTHPRYGVAKTYKAVVDGYIDGDTLIELTKGVWLSDPKTGKGFRTAKSHFKIVSRSRQNSVVEITIREGRNQQVRRLLARLGHKVRDLSRIRMGPLTLKGLDPGEFRSLTPREIRELKALPQRLEEAEKKRVEEKSASPKPEVRSRIHKTTAKPRRREGKREVGRKR